LNHHNLQTTCIVIKKNGGYHPYHLLFFLSAVCVCVCVCVCVPPPKGSRLQGNTWIQKNMAWLPECIQIGCLEMMRENYLVRLSSMW
jgi:hypothetical protein